MRLFVTGATGFIGSHFLHAALGAGHEVTALYFPGRSAETAMKPKPSLTWLEGGLNSVALEQLTGHDALLHLAAYGVSPQPCEWEKAFQINVLDSLLLMKRAVESGISRIVVCGSCVEFGKNAERFENVPADAALEPVGAYAASKAAQSVAATALAREHGIEMAILRLFTVFGDGQNGTNFWPSLRAAAQEGKDFPMSPGEQVRDFIRVEDVARAFLRAIKPGLLVPGAPLAVNIGTGRPETLREFAEYWWEKWGAKGRLLTGALPYRNNEVMRYVPEVSPAFLPDSTIP